MKNLPSIVSMLLGVMFIVFGLNIFMHFYVPPTPTDPTAGTLANGIYGTYLASFMGVIQICAGVLLLFSRTRFLGSLLLLPVTSNIFMFHLMYDFPGNPPIGMIVAVLHAILLYTQRGQLASLIAAPAA